jgi:hypothetical protein
MNRISKAAAIIIIPVLAFLFCTVSENDKLNNQLASASVDSLEVIAPFPLSGYQRIFPGSANRNGPLCRCAQTK